MAITSNEERTANRLIDLEKRFDQFISQDKPGSQLFTATYVPYGGANSALTSAINLRFVNATGTAARTSDTGAELIIESNGTGGVRYSGLRFRSIDTGVIVRSSGRILSSFLAGFFPDASLIFQTVSGAETFQDVMTMRGLSVGIGTAAPNARLDVTGGYFRALDDGTNNAPTTGFGVEIVATGSQGHIQAYNRSSPNWQTLNVTGNPLILNGAGQNVGIGGTPTRKLTLITTANDYIGFGTAAQEKYVFGLEAANTGTPYLTWYDSVSGQHRMRLASDANLKLQNAIYIGSVAGIPTHQITLSADSAGKPSSNTWSVTSDDRTKKSKEPFTHGLAALRAFPRPIEFTYNGEYNTPLNDIPGVGYSAQDVEKIAPKMIRRVMQKQFGNTDDRPDVPLEEVLCVNSGALTQMLHNAILELDDRLQVLEKKGNNNGKL